MQNHIACQRPLSDFTFPMSGALCQWRACMEKSKLYEEIHAAVKSVVAPIGPMSQSKLAEDAGINQSQVSNFVGDRGGMTLANACKVLEVLKYRLVPLQEKITKEDAEALRAELAHQVNAYLAGIVDDEIRYRVGDIITGVAQKQSRQKAVGGD